MESYFNDIDYQIIKRIKNAESRILIAIAWFTNEKIGNELILKKNLDIEIIIDDNQINRKSKNLIKLEKENIDISFIKGLNEKYYTMHNKFCVIDNFFVLTGSYNWTYNANNNHENLTILNDKKNAEFYAHEFRRIKNINVSAKDMSITIEERNEIIELIYVELKKLLKTRFKTLELNLIADWSNEKVKNKIRKVNERTLTNLKENVGHIGLYSDLISKYGFGFYNLASEEEKIEARDHFMKKDLENIDIDIHLSIQYFKLFAIKKILEEYTLLLKDNNNANVSERIFKMVNYIIKEKITMSKEVNTPFI